MSTKPENTFIQSINRLLVREIYHMKIANPYIAGAPDVYYEGNKNILFVEYKYVDVFPSSLDLLQTNKLSRLQADWLERAEANGVQCAVIVGCQTHGMVLRGRSYWSTPVRREEWLDIRLTKPEIADWIARKVHMCTMSSA